MPGQFSFREDISRFSGKAEIALAVTYMYDRKFTAGSFRSFALASPGGTLCPGVREKGFERAFFIGQPVSINRQILYAGISEKLLYENIKPVADNGMGNARFPEKLDKGKKAVMDGKNFRICQQVFHGRLYK